MKKTTLYLIDTLTKDKVWIGINESSHQVHIGIQFPSGHISTGEGIYRDQNNRTAEVYIKKIWQIAVLLSKVWSDLDPTQGNFGLSACISATRENKLPYDDERVEKLAEYVLHLGPKIQEAIQTPMPQTYIEALQNELQKDWDYKVDA